MTARKQQHITGHVAHSNDHSIGTCGDLQWRLAAGAAVEKQLPTRAFGHDFRRASTFKLTIIPFDEVGIDLGDVSISGQRACLERRAARGW